MARVNGSLRVREQGVHAGADKMKSTSKNIFLSQNERVHTALVRIVVARVITNLITTNPEIPVNSILLDTVFLLPNKISKC